MVQKDSSGRFVVTSLVKAANISTSAIINLPMKKSRIPSMRFTTGEFIPIWQFAAERRIKAADDDELIELIRERYTSDRIVLDPEGVVGVEVVDQKGGSYRFERGAIKFTEYRKKEKHDNTDEAREAFRGKVDMELDKAHSRIFQDKYEETQTIQNESEAGDSFCQSLAAGARLLFFVCRLAA